MMFDTPRWILLGPVSDDEFDAFVAAIAAEIIRQIKIRIGQK